MGLEYRDLTDEVRSLMIEEIDLDIANGILYFSSYFNERGVDLWPALLREAARSGDDDSLAREIRANRCLKAQIQRKLKKGPVWADVPVNAHETVAESNFSRFYIRALCVHASAIGVQHIVGYRAKRVSEPRRGSEEKIGAHFDVGDVLADVRATMDRSPHLGMPPGPNSGILACLP